MTGYACVVTAAGRGERLGAEMPKALVPIGGRAMLIHAVALMRARPRISGIVVAAPVGETENVRALFADFADVTVVTGGESRTDSVRAAVAVVPDDVAGILVHDAARPFVPAHVVDTVIDAIENGADGAVPGIPVIDTIKEVGPDDVIVATPRRASLRAVQTPQGFRADVLRAALALPDADATDDAQLVERVGGKVRVVPGHPDAFKVTTPDDVARAEALLTERIAHAD